MTAAQRAALAQRCTTVRAPLAWLKAADAPVAFRACYRCTHGAERGIERVCTHPELLDMGTPQPVAIVRAWGGGCGPDALRLADPALS